MSYDTQDILLLDVRRNTNITSEENLYWKYFLM